MLRQQNKPTPRFGFPPETWRALILRNPLEWRDIADDAFAILLAFALYRLTGTWKPRPDPPEPSYPF